MAEKIQSIPEKWADAYRALLVQITIARLRVAGFFVVFAVMFDGAFEAYLRPHIFWKTFWVRLAVALTAFTVSLLSFSNLARRHTVTISFVLFFAVAVDVETAILATGGLESRFYAGMILLMVGVGLLLPISMRQMAVFGAIIWVIYIGPILFIPAQLNWKILEDNLFFLTIATALALASCYSVTSLREKEFISQQELSLEQEKSERLLLNILPAPIASRLKKQSGVIADRKSDVTVMFADIVGFTPLASSKPPEELVGMLNSLFSRFDDLTDKFGLEKIKTIGDAYMIAGGLAEEGRYHARDAAEMALEMLQVIKTLNRAESLELDIRIGINTGPLVAGVIGKKKFVYDLWGDTVNTASRMESSGRPGKIQVTETTYKCLANDYEFESLGSIPVKGKGHISSYILLGRKNGGT